MESAWYQWNAYSYNGTWNAGNILNADYSYMMRLTLTDFFGSVQTTYDDIASAFTLIDFLNKGGRSIAFGGGYLSVTQIQKPLILKWKFLTALEQE